MTDPRSSELAELKAYGAQLDRRGVLSALEASGDMSNKVYVSSSDAENAVQDEEKFKKLLKRVVLQYPETLFIILPREATKDVLTPEEIETVLKKAVLQEPGSLIVNFNLLIPHVDAQLLNQILVQACQRQTYDAQSAILECIDRDYLQTVVQNKEWDSIITNAMTATGYLKNERIKLGYELKRITAQQVVNATNQSIQKTGRFYDAVYMFADLEFCFSESDKTSLHDRLLVKLESQTTTSEASLFLSENGLFSIEERKKLALRYVQAQPEFASSFISELTSLMGADFVEGYIIQQLQDKKKAAYLTSSFSFIISSKQLSADVKKTYVMKMSEFDARVVLNSVHDIESLFSPDELKSLIRNSIEKSPVNVTYRTLYKWQDALEISRDEAVQLCIEKIPSSSFTEIVGAMENSRHTSDLIEKISYEDFTSLLQNKLKSELEVTPYAIRQIVNISQFYIESELATKNDLKTFLVPFLNSIFERFPSTWVSALSTIGEFYTPEEIQQNIRSASVDSSNARRLFQELPKWGNFLPEGETYSWLLNHLPIISSEICFYFQNVLPFVPMELQQQFVQELEKYNPAAVLMAIRENRLIAQFNPSISLESLVQKNPATEPLPAVFQDRIKDIQGNSKNEFLLLLSLNKLNGYYQELGLIRNTEIYPIFEKIAAQQTTAKDQQNCLRLFIAWTLLNPDSSAQDNISELKTIDEIEQRVFTEIIKRLNIQSALPEESLQRIKDELGGLSPFAIYVAQYESSPNHVDLLRNMFVAIAQNEFSRWRYGSPEDFTSLQDQGILPKELTYDQYLIWQKDEIITSTESLTVSAENVATELRSLITDNAEHLYMQDFLKNSSVPEALAKVATQQKEVGQQLAAIRKSGDSQNEKEKGLALKADYLVLIKNILILGNLTPDEVTQGYLLKGKQKIRSIDDVFKEISKKIHTITQQGVDEDPLASSLVGRMANYFEELKQSGQQLKQELTTEDTSSAQITLEVGNIPVESCQNYFFGLYNECLLGYFEPNTKIILVRNEKGNIIARSIFRLLATNDSGPALHIDTIYSTSASSTIRQLIQEHAYRKASQMSIPFYLSEETQDDQGVVTKTTADQGFRMQKDPNKLLISQASRAPFVYVDSAGGKREGGAYEMTGLLRVERNGQKMMKEKVVKALTGELNFDEFLQSQLRWSDTPAQA